MELSMQVNGLKELLEFSSKSSLLASILPNVSSDMKLIHNTIEKRINSTYNVPFNLSSVLTSSLNTPIKYSDSELSFNLSYKDEPIPLVKFPYITEKVQSESSAPTRSTPLGYVRWKRGKYSRKVLVKIRKDKNRIRARNPDNNQLQGFITNGNQILARRFDDTWTIAPSRGVEGIRTPTKILYGPSLATLALFVVENDKIVQQQINKLEDSILQSLIKYYG